jgi:purine-binding chemotaxis protein CheW
LSHELTEVLIIEVAGQHIGLPGDKVRELVRAVAITPVPRCPDVVKGVIDFRGTVIPVLDLRGWLRLPPRPLEPSDHFVIVQNGARLLALRVDRAVELATVDAGRLEACLEVPGAEAATGAARLPDELVLLPDLDSLYRTAQDAKPEHLPEHPSQASLEEDPA